MKCLEGADKIGVKEVSLNTTVVFVLHILWKVAATRNHINSTFIVSNQKVGGAFYNLFGDKYFINIKITLNDVH